MSQAASTLAPGRRKSPFGPAALLLGLVAVLGACAGAPEPAPVPAPAAEAPACGVPLALALAALRSAGPAGHLVIERHDGAGARAAVEAINAIEPETDYAADTVIVATLAGAPAAVILLATAGCVTVQVRMPATDARRLGGRGV